VKGFTILPYNVWRDNCVPATSGEREPAGPFWAPAKGHSGMAKGWNKGIRLYRGFDSGPGEVGWVSGTSRVPLTSPIRSIMEV